MSSSSCRRVGSASVFSQAGAFLAVFQGQVTRHGSSGHHRPQLPAFGAILFSRGEGRILCFQFGMYTFPALPQDTGIIRDQVPGGSPNIAVAVVVEPDNACASALLPIDLLIIAAGLPSLSGR